MEVSAGNFIALGFPSAAVNSRRGRPGFVPSEDSKSSSDKSQDCKSYLYVFSANTEKQIKPVCYN